MLPKSRLLGRGLPLSVILQFDPQHDVERIKPKAFRPPGDWAHRGEMTRTVLSILRQAHEPMTTRDIALEMLVTRALWQITRWK
jgi:hypothetical protein